MLSAIIENAAEKVFTTFMKEDIFKHLRMDSTQAETQTIDQSDRATFYDIEKGSYKKSFTVDTSNIWADGGFVSTPSDLVRMSNVLMTSNLITPETKKLLWTPVKLADSSLNRQNYALGGALI